MKNRYVYAVEVLTRGDHGWRVQGTVDMFSTAQKAQKIVYRRQLAREGGYYRYQVRKYKVQ